MPRHSFDFRRDEIKDLHAAHLFGAHYIKLRARGDTYRMALYPDLGRDFGDRFEFFERAYRDFPAAYEEVRRVEAVRRARPQVVTLDESSGQPVLKFPVLVGQGTVWFKGPDGVAAWASRDADARVYRRPMAVALAAGTLEVSGTRVRFVPEGGGTWTDESLQVDSPREEMRVRSGIGGYPRIVAAFRSTGRVSLVSARVRGKELAELDDATPLLGALGEGFESLVRELRGAPAR